MREANEALFQISASLRFRSLAGGGGVLCRFRVAAFGFRASGGVVGSVIPFVPTSDAGASSALDAAVDAARVAAFLRWVERRHKLNFVFFGGEAAVFAASLFRASFALTGGSSLPDCTAALSVAIVAFVTAVPMSTPLLVKSIPRGPKLTTTFDFHGRNVFFMVRLKALCRREEEDACGVTSCVLLLLMLTVSLRCGDAVVMLLLLLLLLPFFALPAFLDLALLPTVEVADVDVTVLRHPGLALFTCRVLLLLYTNVIPHAHAKAPFPFDLFFVRKACAAWHREFVLWRRWYERSETWP